MSYNDYRKCNKCGKTRAEDPTVSYHRFPLPGTSNILKARAWAKYCWPEKDWTYDALYSLHNKSRVLCGRHFSQSQFYDSKRQKLSKFAVPDAPEVNELLHNTENIFNPNIEMPTTEHMTSRSFQPFQETQNILAQPSTSGLQKKYFGPPLKPTYVEQNATIEMIPEPTNTQSNANERKGILSEINVRKINELTPREKKLYSKCRKHMKEIIRLRKKLKNKKNVIESLYDDKSIEKLSSLNITNSFIVLLQSQIKNAPKKPKGRRYTLNQKIMALVIYKKSPACYRLLRRMFALPSQSSLNKLLNKVPLKPGINKHIFTALKKNSRKRVDEDNFCILSFDEMSIRKHLNYDPKLDEMQGFQDHGNHGRNQGMATKALVFMLAGIRMKWKQPIAFYFSNTITADRMTVILKEVLTECLNSNMKVVGTVCDMSTVNVRVLKNLGVTTRDPYFSISGQEIVAIFDPPHLLKCTRNLFMKHDVECTTGINLNDITMKGTARWSHLEQFYELDKNNPTFVYAPQLTETHLRPNAKQQMKVSLAAQVFSSSVTAGLLTKIALNALPVEVNATATLTKKFDDLFDSMNADTPDARRGKKYSTNLTASSPHLELFSEMKKFISEMKYIGSKYKPPSQEGWLQSINGIERLWHNLKTEMDSISTRRLNQDPLENCFGCIRYNCGSNNNPTVPQFVAGIKTAIISNLKFSGNKRNCEDDTAILSNNLSSFLKANLTEEKIFDNPHYSNNDIEIMLADAVEAVDQATPESQACGYVCGFIFKNLRHNNCLACKKALLTNENENIHLFITFKEYNDNHSSLNYANEHFIQCVLTIAKIINNYLEKESWKPKLKHNIMRSLECLDFSFLNKCESHFEENKHHIKNSTFYICIKRYCILKNREMDEEEKKKALERKMRILRNN